MDGLKVYAASPCVVAEGPRWNSGEKTLGWVDVTGAGSVFVLSRQGVAVSS